MSTGSTAVTEKEDYRVISLAKAQRGQPGSVKDRIANSVRHAKSGDLVQCDVPGKGRVLIRI